MQEETINWICRKAPSIGELEDTPENIWGTLEFNEFKKTFSNKPCIFFGLYSLSDFFAIWRYPEKKAILWAGTDITHFLNGYWLDEKGSIKISPRPLATWINKNCENYVENEVEQATLLTIGIKSKVVPSFLGKTQDYKISYEWSDKPKLYISVSGNNFEQYGWPKIYKLARDYPDIEFHLYGNTVPFLVPETDLFSNIIIHGRIPKEQMNEEIKKMQGALRLNEFDGFSEIIAKSLLWGQWPISIISYPHTFSIEELGKIRLAHEPNFQGRQWLVDNVNKYPWNSKK